jgi:hypothetical protein
MSRVCVYPASVIMPQRRGTVNHVSKTTGTTKALSSPVLLSLLSSLAIDNRAPPGHAN